jgi:hypothetical protein
MRTIQALSLVALLSLSTNAFALEGQAGAVSGAPGVGGSTAAAPAGAVAPAEKPGIPTPTLTTGCSATFYCSAWYVNISCTGTTSCTVGSNSVTCDGTVTNCPAGTCAPIATGCVTCGIQAEWCQCVLQGGNTLLSRFDCSKALCFNC